MNLNEIKNANLANSMKNLNAEKLSWKLFELTGDIRYYNLCKSLENLDEHQIIFENQTDREL